MFGRNKEKSVGDYLKEPPKTAVEAQESVKVESFDAGTKNLDQLAAQRRQAMADGVKRTWETIKGFGSRFTNKLLTSPERAMQGAVAAKEGVKAGAEFVSDKTRQVHAAGVERVSKVVEVAGQRKDAAVMKLDNGIDVGVKFYEAKRNQFTEWQKSRAEAKAEQERQNLIQQREALLKRVEAINNRLAA